MEDSKTKTEAMKRINQVIERQSNEPHNERAAEAKIKQEANRLVHNVANNKNLDRRQKQETVAEIREQTKLAIADLYKTSPEPKKI